MNMEDNEIYRMPIREITKKTGVVFDATVLAADVLGAGGAPESIRGFAGKRIQSLAGCGATVGERPGHASVREVRGGPPHATALSGLMSRRRHAKERGGGAISEEGSAGRVKGSMAGQNWDGFFVLFVLMRRDHQREAIRPSWDGTRCCPGPSSIAETRG
jgi:hypothetical protein